MQRTLDRTADAHRSTGTATWKRCVWKPKYRSSSSGRGKLASIVATSLSGSLTSRLAASHHSLAASTRSDAYWALNRGQVSSCCSSQSP